MPKELFSCIIDVVESHDEFFHWRVDAKVKTSFSSLKKCTVTMSQLTYVGSTDHYNEYLCIAEIMTIKCLITFVDVWSKYLVSIA